MICHCHINILDIKQNGLSASDYDLVLANGEHM
jgi:hypothetical protein